MKYFEKSVTISVSLGFLLDGEKTMLKPQCNVMRDTYSLNGIWEFAPVSDDYVPTTPLKGAQAMAVPASMNEIVTSRKIRDHEGKVLYERTFSVPTREGYSYRLRIGAVSHRCEVYLNGKLVGTGINGFYPVDVALDGLCEKNRISVLIDNRLTDETLPVGEFKNGRQVYHQDFYNFTGIHRDVTVYSLPKNHIQDVTVKTVVGGDYSAVSVSVKTNGNVVSYTVKDCDDNVVAQGATGGMHIENPRLWSPADPHLYTVTVRTENDCYTETFGIRKVEVKGNEFLLNDKPVYFKGFGMHEDFNVIGKGASHAVNVRNAECLKWINANSFRTSHYPYAEDVMEIADRYGFMVIDEVPAVGMNRFTEAKVFSGEQALVSDKTLALHKELVTMLVDRDKNHPCVVMYSLGNEPTADENECYDYFKAVFDHARSVTDMPLTFVTCSWNEDDKCGTLGDVTCINRYYGWYYNNHGDLTDVNNYLIPELKAFNARCNKPIIVTEYGADTLEGYHSLPSETFSEEFQQEFVEEYSKAFDSLDFVIGEHVWNFADFKTKQGTTRVKGNRKGVFTRDRQPKLVAHFLKKRWENK